MTPYLDEVAAIILAAGRSERMGAFKPLLPFGSQTVIDSCIRL
jgi:CTP:molybdopterin cytidylyltransferase MocA